MSMIVSPRVTEADDRSSWPIHAEIRRASDSAQKLPDIHLTRYGADERICQGEFAFAKIAKRKNRFLREGSAGA
jgi:hypothetical protein